MRADCRLGRIRKIHLQQLVLLNLETANKIFRSHKEMRSGLTTQAQRPGAWDATIATATPPPGSLQRLVRPQDRDLENKPHKINGYTDTTHLEALTSACKHRKSDNSRQATASVWLPFDSRAQGVQANHCKSLDAQSMQRVVEMQTRKTPR